MSLWKELLGELDHRQPLPRLHPEGVWDEELSQEILDASPVELVGATAASNAVLATRAGLLLWNDDLARAHDIVQDLHDVQGSYWHAILHRREGDYDNAKYWIARVNEHPVFASVLQQAKRLWPESQAWPAWSPTAFVDAVAAAVEAGEQSAAGAEALRRVQVVEFSFLLRHGLSVS